MIWSLLTVKVAFSIFFFCTLKATELEIGVYSEKESLKPVMQVFQTPDRYSK